MTAAAGFSEIPTCRISTTHGNRIITGAESDTDHSYV
jgi:hypothetical protein